MGYGINDNGALLMDPHVVFKINEQNKLLLLVRTTNDDYAETEIESDIEW